MQYYSTPRESVVLARFASLLRTGIPAILTLPEWEAGAPCPDEHLLPEGTLLYTTDEPSEPVAPCILLHIAEDPELIDDQCTELWAIRLHAELRLDRVSDEKASDYAAELQALFTGDFTESGGYAPEVNWSTSALQVDWIKAEAPSVMKDSGGFETSINVDFTLHCKFPVPA